MVFGDAAFLPSRSGFPLHFSTNCGSGECLRTATCLKTVVGAKQGHASCRIFSLHLIPILYQSDFIEITRLS